VANKTYRGDSSQFHQKTLQMADWLNLSFLYDIRQTHKAYQSDSLSKNLNKRIKGGNEIMDKETRENSDNPTGNASEEPLVDNVPEEAETKPLYLRERQSDAEGNLQDLRDDAPE
jgi:hypothetical protein